MIPAVRIDHDFELASILLSPVGVAILPSRTWLTVFSQVHFNSIHFSKVKNLTLWGSACGLRIQKPWASIQTCSWNPCITSLARHAQNETNTGTTPLSSRNTSCSKSNFTNEGRGDSLTLVISKYSFEHHLYPKQTLKPNGNFPKKLYFC